MLRNEMNNNNQAISSEPSQIALINNFEESERPTTSANNALQSYFANFNAKTFTNDEHRSLQFLAQDLLNETKKFNDFDDSYFLNKNEKNSLAYENTETNTANNNDQFKIVEIEETKTINTNDGLSNGNKTKSNKSNKKRKNENKDSPSNETNSKKKTKPSNQRRNIKKILTDEKLSESTLRALNEEKARIERLNKDKHIEQILNSFKQELNCQITSSKSETISSVKIEELFTENEHISTNSLNHLSRLNSSNEPSLVDKSDHSVYVIDDDDEEEANEKCFKVNKFEHDENRTNTRCEIDLEVEDLSDVIEYNEDDDDCMIISESEQNVKRKVATSSRGVHMSDELNAPNENGQVLVNVNHPAEDHDVFLLPYLSRNVKPHQIGGIRFMYDNIVESLSRIRDKTVGFGCILAHAMGLGKTLQVVSFVEVFLRCTSARFVLCIVPINTIQNWLSEFNNWLPENGQHRLDNDTVINYRRPFKVFVINEYAKTAKQRSDVILEWNKVGGVLLIGYEMFRTLSTQTTPKNNSKQQKRPNLSHVIDLEEEEQNMNKQNEVQEALLNACLVVCDEGHRIKNNAANIAKTLQTLKTKRRIVLTGYPLQNNLIEYWCMVNFVRPSYLGNKAEFSNMFERPITNGQCMDSTREDVKLMRYRTHVLHSLLEGFVQRRGHDVFLKTLPKKHEYIILLKLTAIQKELYLAFMQAIGAMSLNEKCNPLRSFAICCKIWNHPDVLYKYHVNKESEIDLDLPELQQHPSSNGATGSVGRKASKTSNLAQSASNSQMSLSRQSSSSSPCVLTEDAGFNPFAAADPRVNNKFGGFDPDWANKLMETYMPGVLESGAKFAISFSLIHESVLAGDKILLFSQSLLTLDLIEEYLQKCSVPNTNEKWKKYKSYFRLDGSTNGVERERLINLFNQQNNGVWLFLLSTRAGCLGINLVGANRVIVLDASWNPCHDAQAVCRVFRYGQKKNCFVYRLIADHTMEKKIYERQISKQTMSDRVVDQIQAENHFTRTEVEKLIHFVEEDVPAADLSNMPHKFEDSVLVKSCLKHALSVTKEPFTHESLLIDKKEYQLSEREKAIALRDYEHDKKYFPYARSNSYNLLYQRYPQNHQQLIQNQQLYAQFNQIHAPPFHSNPSQICSKPNEPNTDKNLDFNLHRTLTTPNSFLIHNNNNETSSTSSASSTSMLNKPDLPNNLTFFPPAENQSSPPLPNLRDVKISKFTANRAIQLPTGNSDSAIQIQAGQSVVFLQTPKGSYLRTPNKKYIAVRGKLCDELFSNVFKLEQQEQLSNLETSHNQQQTNFSTGSRNLANDAGLLLSHEQNLETFDLLATASNFALNPILDNTNNTHLNNPLFNNLTPNNNNMIYQTGNNNNFSHLNSSLSFNNKIENNLNFPMQQNQFNQQQQQYSMYPQDMTNFQMNNYHYQLMISANNRQNQTSHN